MNSREAFFAEARRSFHDDLECRGLVRITSGGVPTIADSDSSPSVNIARALLRRMGTTATGPRLAGQTTGARFEEACAAFLEQTFLELNHLRPGKWHVERPSGKRAGLGIAKYDQYAHLSALQKLSESSEEMRVALGRDYLIKPDVVIWREPEEDLTINGPRLLVSGEQARLTSLRKTNNQLPILHASVSCKITMRSDRAQNTRSEALNLVRNRKGHLPHVVAVTAEPTPGRIASLALGTGDVDCVYHVALPELTEAVEETGYSDSAELLSDMVEGKRLRDIADLPFDLVS